MRATRPKRSVNFAANAMAKPRVIFVNRVYWPATAATAQLLTDLAEGLAGRGHEVHVIASGEEAGMRAQVTIHRTLGSARHSGFFGQVSNYFRFLFRARRILSQLVRADDIVVVKTDPPLLAAALTSLARSRGAKVVQWIQDIYPEILPQYYGRWLAPLVSPLRAWRDRAWRASAACIVVGEDMAQTVEKAGVPPSRIHIHPNWAPRELESLPAPEAVAAQRRRWGVSDQFVVAYSGNLGRVHEFQTLLDAASRLSADSGLVFLFIGGGPRIAEVQRIVEARRLANVRFLPAVPREDLPAALAAADLHIVTLRPGFERLVNPSKLAGVLAAGRPALFVGPAQSRIADQLASEACGFAVQTGDVAAAVAAIESLHKGRERRGDMAGAARQAFQTRFTFSSQLAAWESLLLNPESR